MEEFRRNIKFGQRLEYGLIQIIEHFLGKKVFETIGKQEEKILSLVAFNVER